MVYRITNGKAINPKNAFKIYYGLKSFFIR